MIDPDHHRKGYGRTLMAAMEEKLFRNHDRIELESFESNDDANGFYRHTGWQEVERYADPESGLREAETLQSDDGRASMIAARGVAEDLGTYGLPGRLGRFAGGRPDALRCVSCSSARALSTSSSFGLRPSRRSSCFTIRSRSRFSSRPIVAPWRFP
ncbi:GNAT family N-acetyltransferase [Candidatus Bipolaricaulota bacterium]|nr:GNAT family N-acetyltransferase [Candidatus Bipolaricaulota bacterium]